MFGSGNLSLKKFYINVYKTSPELNALINSVAGDIVGNFAFVPVQGSLGRNRIQQAQKFSENNQMKMCMLNMVIDWLMTGEGFLWLKGYTETQIKEALTKTIEQQHKKIKGKEAEAMASLAFKALQEKERYDDEDVLAPREIRYVASSTMDLQFDAWDILGYIQRVAGGPGKKFTTEEIIRITDLMVDGKPYGFTPIHSLVTQIDLLNMMWRNQKALQKNGGAMGKIFSFKDLKIGTPAYERIAEQLVSYRLQENKHGNYLMTGDLTVTDIEQMDGMQFKEVGLYILSILAMHWQIPRSKLPVILGNTNAKSDIGGEAEKSYWANIERKQDRLAEIMNTQLFIPKFGLKLEFDKEYKQDDIREEQVLTSKLTNLNQTKVLLAAYGKQLSYDYIIRRLEIDDANVEELSPEMQQTMLPQQNQMSNDSLMKNDANRAMAKNKQTEQTKISESRGKPSGI